MIREKHKATQTAKYVVSDFFSAAICWTLFFLYRKQYIEPEKFGYQIPVTLTQHYYLGLLIIPLFWLSLYYLTGYYNDIYRKSRLQELGKTLAISSLGVLIIFFTVILDDEIFSYRNYYNSILTYFAFHFVLTYIPRLVITTHTTNLIQQRKIGFPTLIIGSNAKALRLYKKLISAKFSSGHLVVGFININDNQEHPLEDVLERKGDLDDLKATIEKEKIEEVIIAVESTEHHQLEIILNKLELCNVVIKAIPDNCDLISGRVKIDSLIAEPLIEISHKLLPDWQANLKRLIDIVVSIAVLLIFSPLYIALIIAVKTSSPGPAFYRQVRIGKGGKPFKIIKYRSMVINSELNGPALSGGDDDPRITKIGRMLRKTRMDELPQFYNVLRGDMSLVGPRPERQFFIDQIVERAPHYVHLHRVRPGITSWGQVKYGYAQNVDEMIERLNYDIIYIENMSLYLDIKILIYTVKTVFLGRGI